MKCVACSGTGKMKIILGEENFVDEISEFTCIVCKGTGEINERVNEKIGNGKSIWCMCPGERDPFSRFYGNGEHPGIYTHHWRCRKCNGVTQIG